MIEKLQDSKFGTVTLNLAWDILESSKNAARSGLASRGTLRGSGTDSQFIVGQPLPLNQPEIVVKEPALGGV
jgi:hypothetical protein